MLGRCTNVRKASQRFPAHPVRSSRLDGRSPGLRVSACFRLPGQRQWHDGSRLAAYSCGGSHGLGLSPHRVPFSPPASGSPLGPRAPSAGKLRAWTEDSQEGKEDACGRWVVRAMVDDPVVSELAELICNNITDCNTNRLRAWRKRCVGPFIRECDRPSQIPVDCDGANLYIALAQSRTCLWASPDPRNGEAIGTVPGE